LLGEFAGKNQTVREWIYKKFLNIYQLCSCAALITSTR